MDIDGMSREQAMQFCLACADTLSTPELRFLMRLTPADHAITPRERVRFTGILRRLRQGDLPSLHEGGKSRP